MCVLGYCVFPINLAALLVAVTKSLLPFPVKLVLVAVSFGWSTLCKNHFIFSVGRIHEYIGIRRTKSLSCLSSLSVLFVFSMVLIDCVKQIFRMITIKIFGFNDYFLQHLKDELFYR